MMKLRNKIWGMFTVLLTVVLSISVIFVYRAQSERLTVDADVEYLVINSENAEQYLNISSDGIILKGFKTSNDRPVVGKNDKKVIVLEVPENVSQINGGFAGYANLYSVVLPESVSGIEQGAFSGCTHLVEVCDLSLDRISGTEDNGQITDYALNVCYSLADRTLTRSDDFLFVEKANAQSGENAYELVAYLGAQASITLPTGFGGNGYDIYDSAFARNSDISVVDLNGTSVQKIGDNAFNGCSALQRITFPETLNEIGEDAFYDCTWLDKLTIPASVTSIGAHAFFNCGRLSTVTFSEEEGATELSINEGAFQECGKLVAVNFPKHLTALGARAFYGAGLSTVYLPDGVDYGINSEGERDYFDSSALIHLVFKNREAYLNGLKNSAITLYRNKMTYLVNISFDFGTEQEMDTEVRLAGENYSYTAGDNYLWSGTVQSQFVSLPLQNGYSTTVWYAEDTFENKFGTARFGGMLVGSDNSGINEYLSATETVNGVTCYSAEDITLYARYIAKPVLAAKTVSYSSRSYPLNNEACLSDLIDGWYQFENPDPNAEIGAENHLLVASYNGSQDGSIGPDAGTYPIEFQIKDEEAFGAWMTPITVNAVIERIAFDIGDYTDWRITWGNNAPVSLIESQKLYIYEREGVSEKIPFITELTGEEIAEGGYSPNPEVRILTNSVARYRHGEDITLDYVFKYGYNLSDILTDWQFLPYGEDGNDQRTASSVGVYKVRVVLTANENYRFISDITTANDRGIVISFNTDRSVATIIKTWYIVDIANQVVVDLNYGADDERIPYSIADWTFGERNPVLPQAPSIEFFDRTLGLDTLDNLSLTLRGTLYSGGSVSFSDIRRSTFNRFINATMPAGSYMLTVSVPDVTDVTGIYYPAYQESFSFTVHAAALNAALLQEVDENLKGQSFSFKRDGEIHFYDPSVSLGVLRLTESDLNPDFGNEMENVWARRDYREYYSTSVSISYNLNRMADSNYFSEQEFAAGNARFAPRTADNYTVYYQVSAKNYVPHVDTSSEALRRSFVFTVTIYEEYTAPIFNTEHLVYTGAEVIPEIGESSAYEVRRKANDDYTLVGTHMLILRLYSFVPSKWEGQDLPTDEDDPNMEFELTYEIRRAKNETVGTLNLISWTWGSYPADNAPVFNTLFKDTADKDFYTFTLTSHSNPEDVYTYGTEKGFDKAPAGAYIFTAYAKGYDEKVTGSEKYNWEAYSTQLDEVRIAPATNRWLETPNIIRWHWGEFDRNENLITARPAYPTAGAVVSYSVLDGNRQPVKSSDGNEILLLKEFVTEEGGKVSAAVGEVLGRLDVGTYYLIAKVKGAGDFTELDTSHEGEMPLVFHILRAQNLWEETPNIISWNEGNYDAAVNLMFARAKFGDAVITITHMDGTPIDFSELASLKAGAYKMRAVVSGTGNYTGLDSELDFAVSLEAGPLGSPTGQIIALCAIGVLGVALAVMLIINIIRIKRETEEELKNDKY